MSETVQATKARFSQANSKALRNPWVWGWIAMVIVVLGANIGMITTAILTNPGLVTKDYYEQGKAYEENIVNRRAARERLNWNMELTTPKRVRAGATMPYSFRVVDGEGRSLSGADVRLFAYRPSDAAADFSTTMAEIGPGVYQADIAFPLKGIWDLIIHVKQGDADYNFPRRISVQAP